MFSYRMLESDRIAYADWLAAVESVAAVGACLAHARNAGATDVDIDDITHRAHYLNLARTYGEGHA